MYYYTQKLLKYIYGLIHAERLQFKEYIKTMTLKAGYKKCKTEPCLLYRINELGNVIFILYKDDTLKIGDKPASVDTTEYTKK